MLCLEDFPPVEKLKKQLYVKTLTLTEVFIHKCKTSVSDDLPTLCLHIYLQSLSLFSQLGFLSSQLQSTLKFTFFRLCKKKEREREKHFPLFPLKGLSEVQTCTLILCLTSYDTCCCPAQSQDCLYFREKRSYTWTIFA